MRRVTYGLTAAIPILRKVFEKALKKRIMG